MKLNMLERVIAIGIIDSYEQGNFMTFKILDNLKHKIIVTEDEVIRFELKFENNAYYWNSLGNEPIDFDLTDMEVKMLKDKLVSMDENNKLTPNHISLYEKIVIGQ